MRRRRQTCKPDHPPKSARYFLILTAALLLVTGQLMAQETTSAQPQQASMPAPAVPAQQAPAEQAPAASAPSTLPSPPFAGPLQAPTAMSFEAGPLGKLDFDGVGSAMGVWQGNHVAGDNTTHPAINNGFVFFQKADGWFQFYVQAGAYNILSLGTPFLQTDKQIDNLWGPVPVAYVKLSPTKTTSVLVGELPTLLGAEYTFSFQNMNIERGLLWNQENAVNRGIQINQTLGKFTASLSWNDGFYSNRYSWLSGSLTYAKGANALSFQAMGNLGKTAFQNLATPVQNNGSIYALVYTYTKGKWVASPYFQYSSVPTNAAVGVTKGASTVGGAFLLSRTFSHGFSLGARGEYISTTGTLAQNAVNLLYGPGSAAWSATITPTYQHKHFYTRAEFSFVRANDYVPGSAFGPAGTNRNQPRGVAEAGFMF
jgi:Putative beta-barrel porin-2, OmpL-like. bbp2